ncbi:MAG: MFS transporter [Dehalococcoidia bacterium]|nr:MFS transporter [Dehalococcoidia bacterium]
MASEPQGKDAERGAGGPGLVWLVLLSLSLFVLLLPIASYVAALSAIKDELGLNNAGAGALFSAYLAGYAASALFLVPLSDRLGPKRIMYVSAVLSVAAHLLFPLTTHDVVVGVVLRAIAGVGFLGVYIPGLRLVARRFERNGRGSAMGLFVTAQYASHSGSLALTGWLMATMEWRDAYTLVAGLSAVSLPLIFLLVRSVSDTPPEVSRGRLDPTVLKSEPVQFVILGYTVHALNLYALRVWLPVFLTTILVARGVSEGNAIVTAAEVGGLALAFGAVGPVMGGAVSDRLGRTTAASLILGLSAVCAVGLAWIGHWPWGLIVVVCVVFAWAASADSAIYQTGITEVADPRRLGSTMALQASLGLLGGVIGPVLFGGILDVAGGEYRWVFAFSTLGVLAAIAIVGLRRVGVLAYSRGRG